jgi:hypothetical protein
LNESSTVLIDRSAVRTADCGATIRFVSFLAVGPDDAWLMVSEEPMTTHLHQTVPLGHLVAAAFEAAESYSTDRREVSHLAVQAIARMLDHARWTPGLQGGSAPCRSPAAFF